MKCRISHLENISYSELLKTRLCDLDLSLKNSPMRERIQLLYEELSGKGLRFRPHVWISTSWFCPYGIPGFAIPFYLLHPRLTRLEMDKIGEVEGGTSQWCMQLLRHETGHAIDNAFHLRKSKTRQDLFGLSKTPYPKKYSPDRQSTDFVVHLSNHYAQAHPDEDWAETFAVWLDPKSKWKTQYASWPALRKLELVDRLMTSIYRTSPLVSTQETMDELSQCTQTISQYYEEKQDLQSKQNRIFEWQLALEHQLVRHKERHTKKLWIYM